MPIFMDLHSIPGATHRELAEAHRQDLEIQEDFNVKLLTYWYDSERGTAFCLVDAPDEGAIRQLHAQSHGNVPHQIIPVDIMAVKAFLGRITDPLPEDIARPSASGASVDAAFRVVMFTDLKDSTAMTSRLGEAKALELLQVHNRYIRDALRAHQGSEVKHTGDGIMASFARAAVAVDCAIAVQRAFALHNAGDPDQPMYVRIGLHGGEPIEESGDLFGAAIQLAARLCAQSEPGQILASAVVKDECQQKDLAFVPMGARVLKGFEHPVEVYAVEWQEA
jgi:class 3 adenylate cyclase